MPIAPFVSDPRHAIVARRAKAPRSVCVSIFTTLVTSAAQSEEAGVFGGFDPEEYAVILDIDEGTAAAVFAAQQSIANPLHDGRRILDWDAWMNPKPLGKTRPVKDPERNRRDVAAYRQRRKDARTPEGAGREDGEAAPADVMASRRPDELVTAPVTQHVTSCNQVTCEVTSPVTGQVTPVAGPAEPPKTFENHNVIDIARRSGQAVTGKVTSQVTGQVTAEVTGRVTADGTAARVYDPAPMPAPACSNNSPTESNITTTTTTTNARGRERLKFDWFDNLSDIEQSKAAQGVVNEVVAAAGLEYNFLTMKKLTAAQNSSTSWIRTYVRSAEDLELLKSAIRRKGEAVAAEGTLVNSFTYFSGAIADAFIQRNRGSSHDGRNQSPARAGQRRSNGTIPSAESITSDLARKAAQRIAALRASSGGDDPLELAFGEA